MTVFRLKHNPSSGDVAIYSVPSHASTDNTPLTAPFNDPSRLQFHSGIYAPSTTPALTQEVTITIPAQSANTKYDGQINLFAHGKGEPCMVEGLIKGIGPSGEDVAFNGTMPVNVGAMGHATWLALGATDTHVVVVYFGITGPSSPPFNGGFSAFNLDIEASAYDFLASGSAPAANPALPAIKHVKNSHLMLGHGVIDTRRRYLRRVESGGDFALATGPTLTIVGHGHTDAGPGDFGSWVQNEQGWRWRYSCNGYVKETTVAWDGSSTNGGGYNAEYILVKR